MTATREIYEEIMADLIKKGFGGYVQQLDHNYKNVGDKPPLTGLQKPKNDIPTSNPNPKNKNKNGNERPAGSILLSGRYYPFYTEVR